MAGAVIDLFNPGPQTRIQIVQVRDVPFVEFGEELIAKGAMPTFQLAFALVMALSP